jgi:hypothetical protein
MPIWLIPVNCAGSGEITARDDRRHDQRADGLDDGPMCGL